MSKDGSDKQHIVDRLVQTEEVTSRSNGAARPEESSDYEPIDGLSVQTQNDGYVELFANDPEYGNIVREVEIAIAEGILPTLSKRGTSGCYFVQNRERVFIFVFLILLKGQPCVHCCSQIYFVI